MLSRVLISFHEITIRFTDGTFVKVVHPWSRKDLLESRRALTRSLGIGWRWRLASLSRAKCQRRFAWRCI